MNIFNSLINNFPLMMAIISWCVAQFAKVILTLIFLRNKFTLSTFFSSGGMPASHTSTVCALTVAVALENGIASDIFAVCAILSFVVMYDAVGVRRSTGEQAKSLNQIASHLKTNNQIEFDASVREILGHTPLQVFVGAVIGIIIPLIAIIL